MAALLASRTVLGRIAVGLVWMVLRSSPMVTMLRVRRKGSVTGRGRRQLRKPR